MWLISAKGKSRKTTDSVMSKKCRPFKILIWVLEPGITLLPLIPGTCHMKNKLHIYSCTNPVIRVEAAAQVHLPFQCRVTPKCENTGYSAAKRDGTCDCVKVIFI